MLGGIEFGLLNASLLWGLLAVAVPVLIHLWRRRRRDVVDWGAMMFLDDAPGEPARSASRLNDRLLLAVRMALLGLLALALSRPYWSGESGDGSPTDDATSRPSARGRAFVLAIDLSASMDDRRDGISPRVLALRWARRFVSAMGPDDSAALVDAGARGRPRVEPPTRDRTALGRALADMETAGGGPSDLAEALDEAFRILADAPVGPSDVILLTDGRRSPWRPDEALRWDLARELHRRLGADSPRIWAVCFEEGMAGSQQHAASLGPLDPGRSPSLAGRPIVASATVTNQGTRPISPLGQLVVDGRPQGPPTRVGPIAPGGRGPLSFTATIAAPGVHLLSIRLLDDDATPVDDESEGLVEVVEQLPVLIVDGKPSPEPLGGQADFLRIALDPREMNRSEAGGSPPLPSSAFRARVVPADRFDPQLLAPGNDAPRVLVLADLASLDADAEAAVDRFVSGGGGLLIVLGDGARAASYSGRDWFPGRLDESVSTAPTRLDLTTFSGPTLGRFSTVGEAGARGSPLSEVEVFRHRLVVPGPKSVVSAKLAGGDPWCIERTVGKGRVLVVTTALDGRATTLPINPEFVPLAHEWALSLARGGSDAVAKVLPSGEPWIVPLASSPPAEVKTLPLRRPGGKTVMMPVTGAEVRLNDTDAPGVYRLGVDNPSYAVVGRDTRESDPATLSEEDRSRLAAGWPLEFVAGDLGSISQIRSSAPASGASREVSRVEFWRMLVLAALVGLCVESWLARRLMLERTG